MTVAFGSLGRRCSALVILGVVWFASSCTSPADRAASHVALTRYKPSLLTFGKAFQAYDGLLIELGATPPASAFEGRSRSTSPSGNRRLRPGRSTSRSARPGSLTEVTSPAG
jgi:hypothetical protein